MQKLTLDQVLEKHTGMLRWRVLIMNLYPITDLLEHPQHAHILHSPSTQLHLELQLNCYDLSGRCPL